MDINGIKNFRVFFLLIIIIGYSNSITKITSKGNVKLSSSQEVSEVPIDKVFTFEPPSETLTLRNIYLKKDYLYHLSLQLVTPSKASIQVDLTNNKDVRFEIFSGTLDTGGIDKYFNVPFGTAEGGDYKFQITVKSSSTLNLYMRFSEQEKCLYDKVNINSLKSVLTYHVVTISNNFRFEEFINVEENMFYFFYISRVSAISVDLSNLIKVYLDISTPSGKIFRIYYNKTLAGIDSVNWFRFGTAEGGRYTIKYMFKTSTKTNIGILVGRSNKVGEDLLINGTTEDNNTQLENDTKPKPANFSYELQEPVKIAIIGIGVTTISILVVAIILKKREKIKIN